MAGPGGSEVGRVSVRVVPDTDNFRRDVEKELKEVENLEANIEVTLDLEKFKAQIDEIKAQLKSIQDETVNIKLDKDKGFGGIGQGLKDLGIDVKKFQSGLKDLGKDTETAEKKASRWAQTLSGIGSVLGSVAGKAGDLAGALGGQLASAAENFGSSLVQLIVQLVIWVPLLAAAAAGITFLVGAVAAALGGLPALLFGVVGPIAAVVLGFDGLKNAFKTLSPELDKMKKRLSDTFEKGFKPIVASLKPLIPILSDGLNSAAQGVTRFADSLVKMLTSNDKWAGTTSNLQNFKTILQGMSGFLDQVSGGFDNFVASILRAAAQTGVLEGMGRIVGDLFNVFSGFFNITIQDGSLMKGIENLRLVLDSVASLFVVLLENALQFFNGATPGAVAFFDSLTGFFNSIDFEKLGAAFGSALQQVADAINSIPPNQIADFTDALSDLAGAIGDLFSGDSFSIIVTALTGFIKLVALVVHIIDGFVETLAGLADKLGGFFDSFSSLGDVSMGNFLGGLQGGGDGVLGWLGGFLNSFGGLFGTLPGTLSDSGSQAMGGLQQGITGGGGGAVGAAGDVKSGVTNVFSDSSVLLDPSGQQMINGMVNGIRSTMRFIAIALTGIKATVTGAFAGAGGWLVGAGATIVSGLATGIRSMFGVIRATLGALTALIPSWKGPVSVDRKLLTGNGQLIMQSLVDGLNAGFVPVKQTLNGMTSDISSAFSDPSMLDAMQVSGADISAVGSSQLNVAGQIVPDGVTTAIANAMANWNIVMDPTGVARLVKKGNQNLDRRK